ncbi:protein FAM83A-like [Anabas testudineus]|uniref:protein FAM83A-like n=1 Tax=Anabas testudineus TaxID=64144 RepID=UPI000E45D3D6|nr:protein FAM83A-like [Anabas testudineus]
MDASSVSVLSYRRSKPLGKVRRRVQELRVPSHSCNDILAIRPVLDLSHNESARLAVDCLLSQGIEGYHKVLSTEGEVDFLSDLEKSYVLENGRDGNTDDPGASDDDEKDFTSLSADSWSSTRCPAVSTDIESSVADVKCTNPVLVRPSVEIYFQCDSRAAGLKDVVREFIRKANMDLAIVMDSFSDVELLCDLLEASRKRNVSVYLLLDHLNLNLFVSMWQDLKLDSKNFPKLSVRSIDGQTYCAKTGRKLKGQIAESFIITDWTEVLTGSYSFSWLSWQVHRSLAVLVKGSAITPFHQEFHRLYSSSKPVPGFVTFITVPRTLPLHTHATQNSNSGIFHSKSSQTKTISHRALTEGVQCSQTKIQSPDLEHSKGNNQLPHKAALDEQKHTKPLQLCPKPIVQPGTQQGVSVEKPKHPVGGGSTLHNVKTCVEPLERNENQIQSRTNGPGQTHVSNIQSQLAGCSISTTAEKNIRVQEATHQPHKTVPYQSSSQHSSRDQVGTEGLFFQQRKGNGLTKPSGVAAGMDTRRGQWNYSPNLKPKGELPCEKAKLLSPPTSQQKLARTGLQVLSSHQSGLETKVSSLGTKVRLQSYPTTDAPGLNLTSTAAGTHLNLQRQTDSKWFFPGATAKLHRQPPTPQQVKPPPRLNWMPQSHTARPRPVARTCSFDPTYGMGQKATGQLGWRPFQSNMTSLGRSKSLTERGTAGLNPNITTI